MKEIKQKFYRSLSNDFFGETFFIRFDLTNIIFGNDGGIFFQLEYLIC
jgi:hypothetical protein